MIKKLQSEITAAMKEKDTVKRDCLKMVLDKARAIAKDEKTEDVSDDMVIAAAKKEKKQLQQTMDSLKGHEDSALYAESKTKMEIVDSYIPAQMSEEELRAAIEKFAEENGLKGQGKGAMRSIMPVFKDKGDGKTISRIVTEVCG